MSNTKNVTNNNASSNNINTKKAFVFPTIEFQLDNRAIGTIKVVNNTK